MMGNLKQDLAHDPPCHPRACAIQDCLTKNGYKEEKCQTQIDALYECCNAFYQAQGGHGVDSELSQGQPAATKDEATGEE